MADKTTDPVKERLDSLLIEMPRIAEVVKAFPESVQARAFETLMAELRGEAAPKNPARRKRAPSGRSSPEKKDKTPRRRATAPRALRDLDLAPKGKDSFKEFAKKKKPKTNNDKNVASVYYLSEVLGLDAVTVNHVFTCYKDMSWREPSNLANSLCLTASRKRYLDTASLDDIRLTPAGRNHVKHDLPPTKKG